VRRIATLVIASHNPGKLREIADLLRPHGIDAIGAGALGLAEPEETGATFAENATLKARAAARAAKMPALADDSGLAVNALDGAPGVQSARWAGPTKDFMIAMAKVDEALSGKEDRSAAFVCALALATPDGHCDVFEGRVEGHLVWPPRGKKGFGYDPIFVPDGHTTTFGEMALDAKHALSHRARAFAKLIQALDPPLRSEERGKG
jgi:XTP/dITP diphosphohydrolase